MQLHATIKLHDFLVWNLCPLFMGRILQDAIILWHVKDMIAFLFRS